jgi:hypothetical protein
VTLISQSNIRIYQDIIYRDNVIEIQHVCFDLIHLNQSVILSLTIVLAGEVGGFCVENSKLIIVYLRRAEFGGHFNSSLYFIRYLSKRGFHFYQLCIDMDAYSSKNHVYKNRQLIMRAL